MKGAFKVIASLLVVIILLFALSGDCMSAVITPVKAQQSSAEEPGTLIKNWEDDKKDIQRVLDKVNRKGLISEGDYKEIKYALDTSDDLEPFIDSVDNLTVEIYPEKVYRLRFFARVSRTVILPTAKRAFGNERINIYITREDGSMLNFSIIIKNAGIAKFKKGEFSKPTIKVHTTEQALRSIIDSPDSRTALLEALRDGDITYVGVGMVNRGRFFAIKQFSKLYNKRF